MKRTLLAALAALVLAGCADTNPTPVAPESPRFSTGDAWDIFTTQTPAEFLNATGGWEVATRFYVTKAGCITGMRFYRAPGETGSNTVKLWTNSGTLLGKQTFSQYSATTGWNRVELRNVLVGPYVDSSICIQPNTYYRISVNTNTKQAKTYGYFTSYGPIVRGPLVADYSYYGQPAGSFPTTGSGSIYFVDVTFTES